MILWIVLGILVLLVLYVIVTYNSLIGNRNQVDRAYADMDVYLQKRFQLVPNLLATAQKLTDQEQAIFDKITKAREAIAGARNVDERFAAEDGLTQALRGFLMYTEQNPELVSQQGLSEFATSLNEIDTQIRNAQQFYNGAVLKFDNSAQAFPANIVAGLFRITAKPYFKAADEEKQNVNVQFK
jgi:LemA protein